MPREHGDDGAYVETVPLERVLTVFDVVDGPVILSADVADELECSRETARRKLQQLYERGDLARRKVSRRVIYWKADSDGFGGGELQGDPSTTLADTDAEDVARAGAGGDGTETPDKGTNAESEHTRGESGAVIDLDALSFKRDLTPARREQLQAWIRYAADRDDGVSKSDFEDWWTPDRESEAGYNVGSFWEMFAKAAMKQSGRFSKPNTRTYQYDPEGET